MLHFDPTLAGSKRDVEGSVEDDIGDGVEAVRRKILCAADEIASGIVHQAIDRAFVENTSHHVFDRIRDPDVAFKCSDARVVCLGQFLGCFLDDASPAAADVNLGAKLCELVGHFTAETGAASGDQEALSFQEIAAKHGHWLGPSKKLLMQSRVTNHGLVASATVS